MSTHRAGRDPRELASRLVKPRLTAFRKVMLQGNSLCIAPGRTFLHALGLVRGDYVELVLDPYSRRFYVKAAHQRRREPAPPPAEQLPLEGTP